MSAINIIVNKNYHTFGIYEIDSCEQKTRQALHIQKFLL